MKRNSRDVHSSSAYRWLKINKKWFAPILPYLAVWAGMYIFKNAWVALIGFHVAIAITVLLLHSDLPINILFKSRDPKWILGSIIVCSAGGIGLYILWDLLGIADDLPAQLHALGFTTSSWPLFIAYFSLVNPFFEEYFWRGVLGSNSKKLYIGDAAYAGYHILILWNSVDKLYLLLVFITLTFVGWFWRQMAREDEGLLAAVLGHMAADFSIILTIYLMTK
jgi:hypothetical protein